MKKILIVTPRFPPDIGGIETVVFKQSMALSKLGHDVRVITTTNDKGMVGQEDIDGLKVNRYLGFSPKGAYFFSRGLSKAVRNFSGEYDIVHAHNYHAFPALSAFKNRTKARFIITPHYHGGSHSKFRNFLLKPYKFFGRKMIGGADAVVCVSNSEKELLEGDFSLPKTWINYNGVEFSDFPEELDESVNGGSKSICSVGRLERYKNIDAIIRAASGVRAKLGNELVLNIIGNGPDKGRLEGLVEELGMDDCVHFHGFIEEREKLELMKNSSCLVTLSSHESFGLTIVESAKLKVPVVASSIGPHVELGGIIGNSVSLVDASDQASVQESILKFLEMPVKTYSFNNLDLFDWSRNVENLTHIYEKLAC